MNHEKEGKVILTKLEIHLTIIQQAKYSWHVALSF